MPLNLPTDSIGSRARRAAALALSVLVVLTAAPAAAELPQPPTLAARQYLLVDLSSDQVLAERDADARADPASLTKIMTAYLVLQALKDGKLTLEQALPVSERAWSERKGGGSIGIGFAIPSEMVQFVVASAANGGKVQRPWFGGQLQGVTAEIAATLGLGRPVGVLVSGLSRRGPAAQGGLRIGDVIVAVDGREIADPQSFRYRFATRGIGGTSRLKVLRDGRERDIAIALVAAPEDPPRDTRLIRAASPLAGLQVANLSPIVAEELGMDEAEEGVVVVGVASRSPAARAGFKPGDIVRAVNGRDITSTKALEKASQADVRVWRLTVERGGRKTTLVFSG